MWLEGDKELRDLEVQVASKEREWKELQAVRIQHLESSLSKAKDECSTLRKDYERLKEAYLFNLSIVDERDRELQRYDKMCSIALNGEKNRQKKLERLQLQVSSLEEQRAREAAERRQEAAQHQLQLDQLKLTTADEMKKQVEEYQKMKCHFQQKIQELEGEQTLQKKKMTAACEVQLEQQEHQFNLKKDQIHVVLLSAEVKVKLLSKARQQAVEALEVSRRSCEQLQTQLQQKDTLMKDTAAVKDGRIKDLEDKMKRLQSRLEEEQDNHMKKCEEQAEALKRCTRQLEVQRKAHTEQLQRAERYQDELQVVSAQARCTQRDFQEAVEQKDQTIQRLRSEVEKTQSSWDRFFSQTSSETVAKDTELVKLRAELQRSREELGRCKMELSASFKRKKTLEQQRVQVELDCERRCDDMKAELQLSKQLIEELTQARNQATGALQEKESMLLDLTGRLCSVQLERDQTKKVASEQTRSLQDQNSSLRAAVAQMRQDMEGLSRLQHQPQTDAAAPSHIKALEGEVRLLKATCGHLHEQLEGATGGPSVAPTTHTPVDHLQLQNHTLKQGCLEPCFIYTAVKNQEARVAHMESVLTSIVKQSVRQRQLRGQNPGGGVKSGPEYMVLLRSRLKRAMSYIDLLGRDNRQLTDMCNGLRVQLMGGRQGPTETLRDQQGGLSGPETHQSTAQHQELQLAVKQSARADEHLKSNGRRPSTAAADLWSQQHKTTSGRSNTTECTAPVSQSQGFLGGKLLHTSPLPSDESQQPLQELWEMLDHGLSTSAHSESDNERTRKEVTEPGTADLTVYGTRIPFYAPRPVVVQPSRNCSKTSNTAKTCRSSRVRNYNLKD